MINKYLVKHDIRSSKKELIITSSIMFGLILLFMVIFLFVEAPQNVTPEVQAQFVFLSDPVYYFAVQVGQTISAFVLFFGCGSAISAWAKDEKEGTAELVLQLPVSRETIWASRMTSLSIKMLVLNSVAWIGSLVSIVFVSLVKNNWASANNVYAILIFFLATLLVSLIASFLVYFLSVRSKKVYTMKTSIVVGMVLYISSILINILLSDMVFTSKWQEILGFFKLFSIFGLADANMLVGAIGKGGKITFEFWWGVGSMAIWTIIGILAFVFSKKYFRIRDLKN